MKTVHYLFVKFLKLTLLNLANSSRWEAGRIEFFFEILYL